MQYSCVVLIQTLLYIHFLLNILFIHIVRLTMLRSWCFSRRYFHTIGTNAEG